MSKCTFILTWKSISLENKHTDKRIPWCAVRFSLTRVSKRKYNMFSFKYPLRKESRVVSISARHVAQAKQTPSFPFLCLLKNATYLIPHDNLWPVKHAKLCLFLSTRWWQLPAGHLINHTCHWPLRQGRDCFCLFVFLACSAAFLAGFLACPLKAKCESSKLHHLGKRERVWHISPALIVSKLPEAADTLLSADMFWLQLVMMKGEKWVWGFFGFLFFFGGGRSLYMLSLSWIIG